MKQKVIFIFISFFLLIGFTAATGYSIDLDQEANLNGEDYHYSVTSIPTYDGLSAIETSSLENQCSDLRTVTWDGDSGETESDIVFSTRGYVFLAPQECDISIDSEDYVEESAPSLSEGWNIISTGSGVMFDEAQGELSNCQIPQSDVHPNRKKLYKISLEGSSSVMPITESLQISRAYWVEVEEDCNINQENGDDSIVNPPEEDDSDSEEDINDDEHTLGDVYFYDTEDNSKLVRSDAENNYQDENYEYNMYDGAIEGYFEYHNRGGELDTLWVRNHHTDVTDTGFGNSEYLSVPPDSETWGTEQSGLYEMDNTGCTDFSVAVLPEATADPETESLQGPTEFSFCPDNREDDSNVELNEGSDDLQAQDIRDNAGGALEIDSASYSDGRIDVTGGIHTKAQFSVYLDEDVPTVKLMVNGEEVDSVTRCERMTSTGYGELERKFDFSLSADRTLDSNDEVSIEVDHHFIRVKADTECGSGRDTLEMDYSYGLTN